TSNPYSPSSIDSLRIAIAHEWFDKHAGSERVVEQILNRYPKADLFSLVDFLTPEQRGFLQHKPVTTSFLQALPGARRYFRQCLPLMPLAIEQLDFSGYDIIISSHHAVAKGLLTRADQLHVSYVHTPLRYGWDLQHQYLAGMGSAKGAIARLILHYLRLWDVASAHRVDYFMANSRTVARRIAKTYRRPAQVVYPPVQVDRFTPSPQRDEFYFALSRFVPYKRVDLIVAAFAELGLPLVVIGDGPDADKIKAIATANVQVLPPQPEAVVTDHMNRCKAFVYAAEEDFGIAAVEAQAAGAPVIAYGRGGVTETVIPGKTGLLFAQQSVDSLKEAVLAFHADPEQFRMEDIRYNAERFSPTCFHRNFSDALDQAWQQFQGDVGTSITHSGKL
ncbi:MAG: glycosyltransferase, partial [Cyanobacteria bacterium P01_A01_bin.135]